MHVAQAAAALLEIGLEEEGDLARAGVPHLYRTGERAQLAPAPPLPLLTGAGRELLGRDAVAGDPASVEQ